MKKMHTFTKVPLSLIPDLSTSFPWIHHYTKLSQVCISQVWKIAQLQMFYLQYEKLFAMTSEAISQVS